MAGSGRSRIPLLAVMNEAFVRNVFCAENVYRSATQSLGDRTRHGRPGQKARENAA
jgi:hypothetical protein